MFYFAPEVRTDTASPGMCAYRHVAIPRRMVPSWLHCRCPATRAGGGHFVWICQDCVDEGRGPEATLYPAGHRSKDYDVRSMVAGLGPLTSHRR